MRKPPSGIEIGRDVVLKPGPVIDEIFDRQQLGHRQARFAEIVVEPIAADRIGDMRRNPRRTQFHAARHVASPKRHGFAEHADRDIHCAQMRGRRQAIRAGANDRDVAAIIRTIYDDIHQSKGNVAGAGFDFINGSRSDGQNGVIWLRTPGFRGDIVLIVN